MGYIASGTLQADTVIAKTTQTIIGSVLDVGGYNYLTLFFTYTKGDETGVIIQAHMLQSPIGTEHQDCSWTAAAGTKTATANQFTLTATASRYITFDVRGIQYIKFTQGGSNNDGTPTGKLLASYAMMG